MAYYYYGIMMRNILLVVLLIGHLSSASSFSARHTFPFPRKQQTTLFVTPVGTTEPDTTSIEAPLWVAAIPTITTNEEEVEEIEVTNDEDSAVDILAGNIGICLYKSDLKRNDGHDGASTGWTSWVEQASAFRLKNCMDALELANCIKNPQQLSSSSIDNENETQQRDDAIRWLRWIKASPAPVIVELSPELRKSVSASLTDKMLKDIDSTRDEFLHRIGCRMIVLPSGAPLTHPLRAPPGTMIYGTLLFGGMTRFRLIGSASSNRPRRKAGARTLLADPNERTPSWLQYGGPERSYEAVDAGPCAFLEVLILPKGLSLPLLLPLRDNTIDNNELDDNLDTPVNVAAPVEAIEEMTIGQMKWNVHDMLDLVTAQESKAASTIPDESKESQQDSTTDFDESVLTTGQGYLDYLESSFTASVGGLQPQIDSIIRRVLDGRAVGSTTEAIDGNTMLSTTTGNADSIRRHEMETLLDLGLQPVRGLLLYGPPGTGKTLVAREISKVLKARPPKIVAAPELLDRWVGGSEKLVRELFQDAEDELRACGGDPTKSALHVIVIDEIDAVFRKRTATSEDSGEITRASTVNQILTKLDGVRELGNILLIGMTNRRELLDEALLRPGRLEVQIEIPLPGPEGRREILKIHFEALRRRGLLSQSLCHAIDGRESNDQSENINGSKIGRLAAWLSKLSFSQKSQSDLPYLWHRRIRDLASDRWTEGFSGADCAGLVRSAGSLALARARNQDGGGLENLLITLGDVAGALEEVKE